MLVLLVHERDRAYLVPEMLLIEELVHHNRLGLDLVGSHLAGMVAAEKLVDLVGVLVVAVASDVVGDLVPVLVVVVVRRKSWSSLSALAGHNAAKEIAWAMTDRWGWCLCRSSMLWWSSNSRGSSRATSCLEFSSEMLDILLIPRIINV